MHANVPICCMEPQPPSPHNQCLPAAPTNAVPGAFEPPELMPSKLSPARQTSDFASAITSKARRAQPLTTSSISSKQFSEEKLAFAIACLFHEAINQAEFREWCINSLIEAENPPGYLYDLIDFNEALFKIHQPIGHVPHWERTRSEESALCGIAILRGYTPFDIHLKPNEALDALRRALRVMRLFSQAFSFIDLPPLPD